ncbi:MAG: four helix bundle protein [Gemmatimonadetes bacterium]|nr:four helix bundle protein [Gemmatimonadota bacterium]
MADLRNLRVLEAVEDFATDVHRLAQPYGTVRFTSWRAQLVDAADSVAANIAEGAGRGTDPQWLHALRIAIGSANEVGVLLRRGRDSGAIDPIGWMRVESKRKVVCRMLVNLSRVIEERIAHRDPRAQAGGRSRH